MSTNLRILLLMVWVGITGVSAAMASEWPDHPLIQQARRVRAPRVEEALRNGATVGLTPEGKSFYLVWFPEGIRREDPPPVIVTMHGHEGWAFDDFHVWKPFLMEHGYGFVAIQWWLGEGDRNSDYLLPREMYRVFDEVLDSLHVPPGSALLHGFSRGSANIYPVAAMDRFTQKNHFGLFIANAGKANSGYPPVSEVEQGVFGKRPLQGTHWVTFAGAKDPEPERDGIPGMREAGEWIQRYGGTVDLVIEDPDSEHGGFHMNPANTEAALAVFEKLRTVRS